MLARTEHIRVFPDVASLPLRPPPVLAKAAASLDLIFGGRFELGLGAGAFWEAIGAMGGAMRTPREAGEALTEAIDVIRLMWSDQRSVRYDGQHYRLAGVHARIDVAATAAGRDPSAITRIYNVVGSITDDASRGAFEGPARQWIETLTRLTLDTGMDAFVFGPPDDELAQVRRFTEEVVPAVRENVSAARTGTAR